MGNEGREKLAVAFRAIIFRGGIYDEGPFF